MPTEQFNYPYYTLESEEGDRLDFITPIICSSAPELKNYIEVSPNLYGGLLPRNEVYSDFDPDFVPSQEFVSAAKALYQTLSAKIGSLVDSYTRVKPELPGSSEIEAWVDARHGDPLAKWGWNHRIMNVIQFYARKDGGCDLGDFSAKILLDIFSGKIGGEPVEVPKPGRKTKGPGL